MQTSDIERRYRATISPRPLPSLRVSRLSTESPGHDDNLHSHRRRRFIFPFHLVGANFGPSEISRANIRTRNILARNEEEWRFSRVHPVVTTLRIAPWNARLSSKNLHVRVRPILASGQVSVPDLRNSSCAGRWSPVVGGYLHTRTEAAVEGGGRL